MSGVPTEAMIDAGVAALRSPGNDRVRVAAIWRAMSGSHRAGKIDTPDSLPALGAYRRNPTFWSDVEVRQLAVETYRQMTVEQARAQIASAVGWARTPSKSALARCWKRLDLLTKKKGR